MKKECNGYEAYFVFKNEQEFLEHVNSCEECKAEHERMQKVSKLIEEVRPYFTQKKKNDAKLKMVSVACLMFLCVSTLGIVNFNTDISDTIKYGTALSAEDLGLPVDSYGLIMVE